MIWFEKPVYGIKKPKTNPNFEYCGIWKLAALAQIVEKRPAIYFFIIYPIALVIKWTEKNDQYVIIAVLTEEGTKMGTINFCLKPFEGLAKKIDNLQQKKLKSW